MTAHVAHSMRVLIPTPLRSYTGAREVEASGGSLSEVLLELDRRYPGFRFRMVDEQDRVRPHIRVFVNGEQVFDLQRALQPSDAVHIVQALSGG
jgi:molybdopterin converting factor small subunit